MRAALSRRDLGRDQVATLPPPVADRVASPAVGGSNEKMIWQQPPIGGYPEPSLFALPGIERMRASREGRVPIPPIAYLTEMPFRELSEGHAGFELRASPWFSDSAGVIGGGMLAVLADAALGAPIHTELPAGVAFTTAEMSMTFLVPVRPDPEARISGSGHVIHRGRTLTLSEAFLYNEGSESLVAHGTSRCTVVPPIDPLPDPPGEMPVGGDDGAAVQPLALDLVRHRPGRVHRNARGGRARRSGLQHG